MLKPDRRVLSEAEACFCHTMCYTLYTIHIGERIYTIHIGERNAVSSLKSCCTTVSYKYWWKGCGEFFHELCTHNKILWGGKGDQLTDAKAREARL
jgi:hypothetical protein